ncbi:hypothetical protein LQW54_006293 [Pestalotiopsis sp. IQ-011]
MISAQASLAWLLASATSSFGAMFDPYYANMTWQPPRTLSNWANLTVATPSGTFIGMLNDTDPDVRHFLRVPYAQFVSGTASLWNMYQPPNTVINIGEHTNAGAIAWSTAEDCLSLGIWTPSYANETSKLPVAVCVTGGGGLTGGINIASQLPTNWVSRSQEHIVVTMNYRVGILGNPESRAVDETSLTLLDVRAAVEWVSENIELFGGDEDNIMVRRLVSNLVAKSPAIISNAATEIPTEGNLTGSISAAQSWSCYAYRDSFLRQSFGLDTYRYIYAGNFSNISPVPWLGAFHWSDVLMIFGTYMLDVDEIPQLEIDTSKAMQDFLLAFARDAASVSETRGWPRFDANVTDGGQILEFGNGVPVKNVTGDYVDWSCWDASATNPYYG